MYTRHVENLIYSYNSLAGIELIVYYYNTIIIIRVDLFSIIYQNISRYCIFLQRYDTRAHVHT